MLETQATTDTNETQAPAKPKYKWTVLVYLAGDNNLSAEMIYGLLEMKAGLADSRGDVAVVAQLNPRGGGLPVQRYVICGDSGAADAPGGDPDDANSFSVRPGSLPADALLAQQIVDDEESRILPEMLRLVIDHHDKLPILAPTVSRRSPERLAEIETQLTSAVKTADRKTFSKRVQENAELLPAFKDASLTDDTGNPWTLLRFLFWGIDNFEADKYMVVLSGHGSGAVGDFLRDDSSGGSLTVAALGEIFTLLNQKLGGRSLDILGLDSCLMSMAEVYCELSGKANIVIGAEGYEPNTGWPYRNVFEPLVKDPDIEARQYAKLIVDKYANYYFDYSLNGVSVDLAACDCDSLIVEGLIKKVKTLVSAMKKTLTGRDKAQRDRLRDAIVLAHWNAQTYKFDQYADLHDFCDMLAEHTGEVTGQSFNTISKKALDVSKYIDQKVVLNSRYSGPAFQYSYGLSVYFPWAMCSKEYPELTFADKTEWGSFLELFIDGEGLTRRPPRSRRETKNPVFDKVFKPCPDKMNAPRVSAPGGVKAEEDPCKHASMKFTKPCDRGPGERATNVKNPPLRWAPLEARNEE